MNRAFAKPLATRIVARAVALAVLLVPSASFAGFTIAPFALNLESKTLAFDTSNSDASPCGAAYGPGAVFSSLVGTTLDTSDTHTPNGTGNIAPVTGWLAQSALGKTSSPGGGTPDSTAHFATVLASVPSTLPQASPALATLGGLMAIAALYVIRKRSSGSSRVLVRETLSPAAEVVMTTHRFTGRSASLLEVSSSGVASECGVILRHPERERAGAIHPVQRPTA